jgi:Fic family protein
LDITMPLNYEKSHPWITFLVDTRQAGIEIWLRLGEIQSKCRHIAATLLDPKTAKELQLLYLAKGARATTAIEGNTLTEEQVRQHLSGKLELPPSKEYLGIEIDNIVNACNKIADSQFTGTTTPLTVDEIKKYNFYVLNRLPHGDDVIPGEIRKHSVGVARYRGAPAEECQYLLERMCQMLKDDFSLGQNWPISTGVLKAILAHLYIAWIHPFGDGNGRTARLVEFMLCISAGIPAPAAHLLSNHYNETRSAYYLALDKTSKECNPFPFIAYALQGYADQLSEQLERIRQAQYKAFWTNYVYSQFEGFDSVAHKRRRDLLLAISDKTFENDSWILINKIEDISFPLHTIYAEKTSRMKARDINALISMDLLQRVKGKVRPCFEKIEAYLPKRVSAANEGESTGRGKQGK